MANRIRIKPAAAADFEAIAARARNEEIPSAPLAELLADGCLLVAVAGKRLQACGGLDLECGRLVGPFVEPAARGGGLGRIMVVRLEQLAARYGLLHLEVHAPEAAAGFYRACGYRVFVESRSGKKSRGSQALSAMRRAFPRRQTRFGREVAALGLKLGIPADYGARHRLRLSPECTQTVSIGQDTFGREARMAPRGARAWLAMQAAAADQGIEIQAVSAFRSVAYQAGIITRKLKNGQDIDEILRVSAAPGFSEHHGGYALDITTPGFEPLQESFEKSPACRWLMQSAGRFGFTLSYPRGNRHGVAYEPWHWCWHA